MYWYRSINEIAAAWDAEMAAKLEAGATPLMAAGAPTSLLPSLPALLAMQQSVRQRTDVTVPLLVAGGSSSAWAALFLAPQPVGDRPAAPEPAVIFAGADPVTYHASLGMIAADVATPLGMWAGTTPDVASRFAPRLLPGAVANWESLPCIEAGDRPALPADRPLPPDTLTDWIGGGVMLLALCLVLSALLI